MISEWTYKEYLESLKLYPDNEELMTSDEFHWCQSLDELNYQEKIELREFYQAQKVKSLPRSLYFDYKNQQWIE